MKMEMSCLFDGEERRAGLQECKEDRGNSLQIYSVCVASS